MKPPRIRISHIRYFPVQAHWKRLRPFYQSKIIEPFWRFNLRDYAETKSKDHGFKYNYEAREYRTPSDFDGCDWRLGRRGRHPEFWKYVCHSACHWVVDMNLHVAMIAYPKVPWRIVTSQKHSTVWNGSTTDPFLFDLNFLALGVPAKEAWQIASKGRMLKPGRPLRPYVFEPGYFRKPAMQTQGN